ncbi:MAG: BamA/TamA family outer membrane protein [Rubricoccaceae bacterium]|nr:BamA/TamA family outer membrane protein [Rubricoccaceae bacterium]
MIGVALWACCISSAVAQDEQGARLADVRIEGELEPFSKDELYLQLRTQHNRRFLGLRGVTPGVWLYNLGGEGEGGLASALRRAGEAPATYDSSLVTADVERLVALYVQEGYHGVEVAASVDTLDAGSEHIPLSVRVSFSINRGTPTYVRALRYTGLNTLTAEEREDISQDSELSIQRLTPDSLHFNGVDQRFAERELLQERSRIIDHLRSIGFARATRDSIQVIVYGMPEGEPVVAPPDSVDLVFDINTGEKFRFGDVEVTANGPEEDAVPREETIALEDGAVQVHVDGDNRLSSGLIRQSLAFTPGERYNFNDLLRTKQRLERSGVFSFSDITPSTVDTMAGGNLRLAHHIALRTRQRHSVRFEGSVLERTGLLGAEDNEVAFGAGVTYRNANLFGGGEAFSIRATGSVAGDISNGFPTSQAEIGSSLTLSSLIPPFGFAESLIQPLDTRTQISLGFLTARQEALGVIIRGRASFGVRPEISHTPTKTSILNLLDISLSDPDTLDGFSERFLLFVEDPVARQFVLEDYTRPQINTAFGYSFRSITANPFRRDAGSAIEASAEIGGNLAALFDRFVFTPDSVEGSLPGLPFFDGDGTSRLEYRPYIRGLVDARRYFPGRGSVLAVKMIAGVAHPTGASPVVPFDRRFYSGGASSVRGWRFRTLGPGSLAGESAFVQGGDIKLEMSAETRLTFLRSLFQADWQLALFADAGNVWFGPRNPGEDGGRFAFDRFYQEIAIGGGYGLRIAWDYLILRFDLGYKIHSPVAGEGFLPNGLGGPVLHFGIGQAF